MSNTIATNNDSQKCLVDIGELVTNTTNVGYVTLEDGKLKLIGFDGLYGHRGRLELINNVLLITQDDDPTVHDTVLFCDEVLAHPVMIDYFKQLDAIDCIFVRVWNVFTQCKGVHVYGK